jgi:hypothetical protein
MCAQYKEAWPPSQDVLSDIGDFIEWLDMQFRRQEGRVFPSGMHLEAGYESFDQVLAPLMDCGGLCGRAGCAGRS